MLKQTKIFNNILFFILSLYSSIIIAEQNFQLTALDSKNSSEITKQKNIPLILNKTNSLNFFTVKECNSEETAHLKLKIKVTPITETTYTIKYQYFYIPITENQCFNKPINISIIENTLIYNTEESESIELFKYNDLYYYINEE